LCKIRVLMQFHLSYNKLFGYLLLPLAVLLAPTPSFADVVKPALVDIQVNNEREIKVEVRASIEALLTGINARYKNTQDAPNADEYDEFRKLPAEQLHEAFVPFQPNFVSSIYLKADDNIISLAIDEVDVPPPGYTKVPRISVIYLSGELPAGSQSLQWYYPEKFGDNAVRVQQIDLQQEKWHWSQWQWLRNDKASEPFSLTELVAEQPLIDVIFSYIVIGFEHIIPLGLDHILFILGLFLMSTRLSPLLWQVTMFTLAHTITLGLAMNGIIELPANVVEPLIALSIAYVGLENILDRKLQRSRLALVFMFGLLHGLGFASVLSDFGMPKDDFAVALISFNIGVEFGQLAVILMAYLLIRMWFKDRMIYRKIVIVPGSLAISVIGLYWFFERLELF